MIDQTCLGGIWAILNLQDIAHFRSDDASYIGTIEFLEDSVVAWLCGQLKVVKIVLRH
jgi:hypothetical protein